MLILPAQAGPTRKSVRLFVLCSVFGPAAVHAFTLESLVMPGPVAEAHAEYEDDCAICHVRSETQDQSGLCVACHTAVGADVSAGLGLHGRNPLVQTADACSSCHVEHEGRDADIGGLGGKEFDHGWTDFALEGAHAAARCTDCHRPDQPFRRAATDCAGCHADDDAHLGALGERCNDCHAASDWQRTSFGHAATGFPLTGEHQSLACAGCHADQRFIDTPTKCADCHAENDVHQGRNGAQCESCHAAGGWTELTFNHLLTSGFALEGAHMNLACEACHRVNLTAALDDTCNGCHRNDDVHEGRLGGDCSSCHGSSEWAETGFDHDQVSGFPLAGAHDGLGCTSCHDAGLSQQTLPTDCAGCHADDPHLGQLGAGCASCHSEITWTGQVRFDHGLTVFPLVGAHGALGCESCHASAAFHDADAGCQDCHGADDAHSGSLGGQCGGCHNPAGWERWTFDHDLETGFVLIGAHAEVECAMCHRRAMSADAALSTDCRACHARDDPHFGRFGDDCERCHTTESFFDVRGL